MTQIHLAYTASDSTLAARIRTDLEEAGYTLTDSVNALTVILFSGAALKDPAIMQAVGAALDGYQHIIPVMAQKVALPHWIDHLIEIDLSNGYRVDELLVRVAELSAPDAPRPQVTISPSIQRRNQQNLLVLTVVIVVIFAIAIIGVMAGVFLPPADEFASVETQIFLTRNYYIDRALPRSTDDALGFEATLEDSLPTVQPILLLTATGMAVYSESTHYPRSTEDATAFPATLARVSTVVQDRMAATVTQRAATAAAITPTPMPEASATPDAGN